MIRIELWVIVCRGIKYSDRTEHTEAWIHTYTEYTVKLNIYELDRLT